jgi:hypothetical protein
LTGCLHQGICLGGVRRRDILFHRKELATGGRVLHSARRRQRPRPAAEEGGAAARQSRPRLSAVASGSTGRRRTSCPRYLKPRQRRRARKSGERAGWCPDTPSACIWASTNGPGNYGPTHPISQARKCKLSSVLRFTFDSSQLGLASGCCGVRCTVETDTHTTDSVLLLIVVN